MRRPTVPALVTAAALALGPSAAAVDAPAPLVQPHKQLDKKVKVRHSCVKSVPDPGSSTPVKICFTIFRPIGASRHHKVPMIMHSHGWGGSRTTDPAAFARWLNVGYGVISFDQRGFGESGGMAYVENPAVEGQDVRRLVRVVFKRKWVIRDGRRDPRLGAIGGSYGGGYQFLGAFTNLARRGTPVFDALAPEITWNDLNESLAPQGVVRNQWALALSAASAPSQALPPDVYTALAQGAATGDWPDGSKPGPNMKAFFEKNGPSWHVGQGRRLDIPVLFGQGATDTLFPLQQGLTNWRTALTKKARKRSIFVGYNGGHVLPAVYPQGVSVTSDPCSEKLAGGEFAKLARKFMDEQLKGKRRGLRGYGKLHLATPDSTCTTLRDTDPNTELSVGTVSLTTAAGVAQAFPIAPGPIRVAGSGHLTGTMTALGANNKAFFGLAVGTSPKDAKLVQNNVYPYNSVQPVVGQPVSIELPAAAIDVPAGQTLYLLASPISDTFVGMGSRAPGALTMEDTVAHLHVVP